MSDPFSDAVLPRWLRVSAIGLIVSLSGAVIGELTREALRGNTSGVAIAVRLTAAAVYGFGVGFTLLFLILLVAGLMYWLLRRR